MGNKGSKMKSSEVKKFSASTHFSTNEVKLIYMHFKQLANNDDKIDKTAFLQTIGKESLFMERLFAMFDANHNGHLDFEEFINGLSILSTKASFEEKRDVSFGVYDFSGKKLISKEDLHRMLASSIKENDIVMSEEQVSNLVGSTFDEADIDKDGFINFSEYSQLADKHPSMLNQITLNVSGLIASRTKSVMNMNLDNDEED